MRSLLPGYSCPLRAQQALTPELLQVQDLKIRTVVDLRGRAEGKKKKTPKQKVEESLSPEGLAHGQAPPPLLTPDQLETLRSNSNAADADTSDDMLVTRLKRQGSLESVSSAEFDEPSTAAGAGAKSSSSSDKGVIVRKATGEEELQAGLAEEEYGLMPETENFNLIPTKEFGLAMLRMPG